MRFLILFLLLVCAPVYGEPKAVANGATGQSVTLHDEPCAIPVAKNLKYRAVWKDGEKNFEGCYIVQGGIVVAEFDDRTVIAIPGQYFTILNAL